MAELPFMPIHTDALLADTAHMTAEQFGAYARILFTMWRHGGKLPDVEGELARIGGLSIRRWRSVSDAILRPLTRGDGFVSQKRLTDTWLNVQALRARKAIGAAKTNLGKHRTLSGSLSGSLSAGNQNQNQKRTSFSLRRQTEMLLPLEGRKKGMAG